MRMPCIFSDTLQAVYSKAAKEPPLRELKIIFSCLYDRSYIEIINTTEIDLNHTSFLPVSIF